MIARTDKELVAADNDHWIASVTSRQIVWAFAALFLLNLLLRVFYLRYDFVNGDEGVRALTAIRMLDGAQLYRDVVTDKPPGTTLFYAMVFALFGRSMKAVHLAATLWNFITAIFIYLTATLAYSKRIGLWAAFLFVYFSTNYFTQDMMAANTELLMILPYTASLYFFLRASQERDRNVLLIAAGLMTGLAVMFKQVGVLNLFFFGLYELFEIYKTRKILKTNWIKKSSVRLIARLSLIALGFALVITAFVLWLVATGAVADFWRNAVEINMFYIDSEQPNLWIKFMIGRGLGYVLFNLALWSLAAWTIVRSLDANFDFNLTITLWGATALVSVLMSGRFFGHYFITVLPALSLLAAPAARQLEIYLRDGKAKLAATALALFFLIGFVRAHHRTAILAYETLTGARTRWSEAWGMTERQREADRVKEALRDRLEFGEPLYIWGYAHDVYWRTGCRPASRYLTPYYIDGRFPDAESILAPPDAPFWKETRANFIEDLRRTRPRLILDISGKMDDLPYPEIVKFIKENYRDEGRILADPQRPFRVLRLKDD
ncbi:MAG TPA: glycosyltransferase family 39 protein [Blastocatellia bacterium]|nr:glycosyltransferase family 39 protein [Blastocatellia bacterium]